MKPSELPVHQVRNELIDAVRNNSVVIVEGPTGCGKTTQVPQMIRDAGIIDPDLIVGVTQPRRIAAVSVAHRIAAERGVDMGDEVAYAIRFDNRSTAATRIKIMTDGLLLQEARMDLKLSHYGVIMVDEAHERSLNIDFTIGLLRRLIDERPDFRVIVSSATIQPEAFVRFFGGAPRVAATAENFPVDIQWRPVRDDAYENRVPAVTAAIKRIHKSGDPGDILVFLTGEAEIKNTALELAGSRLKDIAILPLYGRLTRVDQERVFKRFPGKRKIILATNIAETSVTIDGVKFVIDLGLQKVPSYDLDTGISNLR